jgi:magnesium/proton exchanger
MAVKDGPKKVYDVGVFAVTSLASMWAYIWLFLVLTVWSPEHVSLAEGWWTLVFFFALILFAYTADRVNNCFERKRRTHEQIEE